jgi:hypothetical protein
VPGLRLGDGGLDLLERKRELVGVQLLRARSEPGALHLPQQRLQPRRMGLLIRDLRLEMRPGRALGGQFRPLGGERRGLRLKAARNAARSGMSAAAGMVPDYRSLAPEQNEKAE